MTVASGTSPTHVSSSTVIEAPVEAVWALLKRSPDRFERLSALPAIP
jgi:hypothetical protein